MMAAASPARPKRRFQRSYAGPACPCCDLPIPPERRASGRTECQRCGQEHEGVAFVPATDPGPAILPATADGTPCAQHVRNAAVASCGRCGAFICQLCRIDSDAQTLCPGCFDRLAAEGALPSARRVWRDHGHEAVMAGILGVLFWFAGIIIGPAAIWMGIKGLRERRRTGVPISALRCIIGIGLGILGTGIGVVIIVVLVLLAMGRMK